MKQAENVLAHPQGHGEKQNHTLHKIMLGTALVAGAVILSPYILPALGIGGGDLALEALTALHGAGLGTGLAGVINAGLTAIPLIGPTLAEGGLISAATSGAIGIGGVLLGKFIEKKRDGKEGINWGRVIKYGALLTSALIALPSVLTGISVGLVYLSAAFSGVKLASAAVTFLGKTLGAMGSAHLSSVGLGGAAAELPHLLTCGAALFPTLFSARLAEKAETPKVAHHVSATASSVPERQGNASVRIELAMNRPTSANVPTEGKLYLTYARSGQQVTDNELAVTYTRKLHLYVTDQSLKDYHHVHPEPTGEPGVFTFSFTPQTSNQYNAWTDFTLLKNGSNHRIKVEIPAAVKRNIPAIVRANQQAEKEGLVFHWRSEPLRKGAPSIVEVTVTDSQGNPVTDLEPVMGAYAHLAGFGADGKHFIHAHPLGVEPVSPDERGGPTLRFHIEPDHAGPTQFYLQVKHKEQDVYVPFGQQIMPPERVSERIYAPDHAAMHPGCGL